MNLKWQPKTNTIHIYLLLFIIYLYIFRNIGHDNQVDYYFQPSNDRNLINLKKLY